MGTSFFVPASCLDDSMYGKIQNAAATWLGFWHNHPTRLGEMEKRRQIPNILFQSKYFYVCSKNVSCAQCHGAFSQLLVEGLCLSKGGSAETWWNKDGWSVQVQTPYRQDFDVAGAKRPRPASLFGVPGRRCRRHDSFCGINFWTPKRLSVAAIDLSGAYLDHISKVLPLE